MLLAPLARTAKLVLERMEVFVMDAILPVPCTLTPPVLKAINESLMKACPPFVLLATLRPFCVKCRIEQRTIYSSLPARNCTPSLRLIFMRMPD
jgi:hypothetical protein